MSRINFTVTIGQQLPNPDLFRKDAQVWKQQLVTYLTILNLDDYLKRDDKNINEFIHDLYGEEVVANSEKIKMRRK